MNTHLPRKALLQGINTSSRLFEQRFTVLQIEVLRQYISTSVIAPSKHPPYSYERRLYVPNTPIHNEPVCSHVSDRWAGHLSLTTKHGQLQHRGSGLISLYWFLYARFSHRLGVGSWDRMVHRCARVCCHSKVWGYDHRCRICVSQNGKQHAPHTWLEHLRNQ
jgi:hypothetical protein